MSWSARIAHTSTGLAIVFAGPVARLAAVLVTVSGCQGVKTWEEGARIEAKVSAEKCPDAGVPLTERMPRVVNGLCKVYGPGEFSAFAQMTVEESGSDQPGAPSPVTEIWRATCFRGLCELATLSSFALRDDRPVEPFELRATRGKVVKQRGSVFEIRLDGQADQMLTVDLDARTLDYRQSFVSGHKRIGRGSCTKSTMSVE
jgi:hypothetical protein